MDFLDWGGLSLYFIVLVIIGVWSYKRVKGSKDFFVAGGKVPWWLSGISHHATGYSATVFVAYAGIAYSEGFTIYVWWALTITIGMVVGAYLIAPRWVRLRQKLGIESPTEYLSTRYNVPTQQLIAWSGVLLKLFELGAKWAAIGILLNVFTGVPISYGILLSGVISLIYITIGGLWADLWTDLTQLIVQVAAVLVMAFIILNHLGGIGAVTGIWDQLPEANSQPFREPYTFWYFLAFLIVNFLSYNGGTWSLANRFISTPSVKSARRSALLSGGLMLTLPLFIFFPMWAAPIILPDLDDPTQSYALMAQELLPVGMVGLVLAGLFSATMSSTSSDVNTISAVITRDILPRIWDRFKGLDQRSSLKVGRVTTFIFTSLTLLIGIQAENFGGVLGLTVQWFGALVGPVSVPLLFGLLPIFRNSGPHAAFISIAAGFLTFIATKFFIPVALSVEVGAPVVISALVFAIIGFSNRTQKVRREVDEMLQAVNK